MFKLLACAAFMDKPRPVGVVLSSHDEVLKSQKMTGPKAGRALEGNEKEHDDEVALYSWRKSVESLV